MSQTRLSLCVVRTATVESLVEFYTGLVGTFQREQHGKGPVHWSIQLGPTLLEIYPLREGETTDAAMRLGFAVPDLDAVWSKFAALPHSCISPPQITPWGKRALLRDPDGRTIELSQSS